MKIRVQLFAAMRQAAGRDSLDVELPQAATVAHLRRQLAQQLPQMASLLASVMFAVDAEYAADPAPLREGAEVACIPPVSGG